MTQLSTMEIRGNVYLAGPMTGKPAYNQAAFLAAKTKWEKDGYYVITPFETNSLVWERHFGRGFDPNLGDVCDYGDPIMDEMIVADVQALAASTLLVLLDGWEYSKGAKLEAYMARLMHKPIFTEHGVAMLDHVTIKVEEFVSG